MHTMNALAYRILKSFQEGDKLKAYELQCLEDIGFIK